MQSMNYGRYEIIKEVGRGSMGVVFQARDPQIDRLVAVKVLRADRMESENFVQRFLKEAKVIGRLTHPHIVVIYDVGQEEETVYIAMEFLEGISLSERFRGKEADLKEVVSLGIQLAETLDYAHQKGVVHRDIKPSNIIVQGDGQLKITDFGIAHVDDATATLQTQAGEIMGTPAYMSPEQVKSEPVDGRSDIFSLGIILYELCTGKRPFGGETKSLATVLTDIIELTPTEPSSLVPGLPKALSRVVMKALQKDPEKRFQTGKEFAEALRHCLDASASRDGERAAGSKRNTSIAAALGIAAVVTLAGIGIYTFSSGHKDNPAPVASERATPPVKSSPSPAHPDPLPAGSAPRIPEAAQPAPPAPSVPATPPVAAPAPVPAVSRPAAPPAAAVPPAAGAHPAAALPSAAKKMIQREDAKAKDATRKKAGTSAAASREKEQKPDRRAKEKEMEKVALPAPRKASTETARQPSSSPMENPAPAAKPLGRFAFLRVMSTPPGARVFINGAVKGSTPMIMKLDLGQYQIRLSRPGYQDVQRELSLEKMKEYPLVENLKPTE